MIYETLNTITEDLLKVARGSIISESEPISKRQIENWVHQYRAVLLAREIEKGNYPNPDFIQNIPLLETEQVRLEGSGVGTSMVFPYTFDFPLQSGERLSGEEYLLRTKLEIPKTIDLKHKPGFTFVGDVRGNEYQFVPEHRHLWQKHKRYTNNVTLSFLSNNRIYLTNNDPSIEYISIRGIFENPMEVGRFLNPVTNLPIADWDTPYPMPNNLIPTLKEMIIGKELKIQITTPSDTKNDSNSGLSENKEK